jgi:hypothetical protein
VQLLRFCSHFSAGLCESGRFAVAAPSHACYRIYCTSGLHLKIYRSFKKYFMGIKNRIVAEVVSWSVAEVVFLLEKVCLCSCVQRNGPAIHTSDACRRLDRPTACETSAHIARPSSFSHRRCPHYPTWHLVACCAGDQVANFANFENGL